MTSIKKATATPEEWARHLEYHRLRRLADPEKVNAKAREYNSREYVKAKRRAKDQAPERVARRKAYHQTEQAKARANERYKARVAADPNFRANWSAYSRKMRTGFSPELVASLLAAQDNRCAICQASFADRRMVADHSHSTGQPRGLLCHHCNIIEGMLVHVGLDPVEFARRLSVYLVSPPALTVKLSGSQRS